MTNLMNLRRKSSSVIYGVLSLTMGVISGCGADESQEGELHTVHVCKSDFEATVHEGPSAPLSLQGTLTLTGDATGAIGYLTPAGTTAQVPVNAQFVGSDIALRFFLSDGTVINGQGPATTTLAACSGQMTGTLTGPKLGDKGDWLAHSIFTNLECQKRCYFHSPIPNSCSNLCQLYGHNTGTPGYESCYQDCVNGPDAYYCDRTTSFFDPCTL